MNSRKREKEFNSKLSLRELPKNSLNYSFEDFREKYESEKIKK